MKIEQSNLPPLIKKKLGATCFGELELKDFEYVKKIDLCGFKNIGRKTLDVFEEMLKGEGIELGSFVYADNSSLRFLIENYLTVQVERFLIYLVISIIKEKKCNDWVSISKNLEHIFDDIIKVYYGPKS